MAVMLPYYCDYNTHKASNLLKTNATHRKISNLTRIANSTQYMETRF